MNQRYLGQADGLSDHVVVGVDASRRAGSRGACRLVIVGDSTRCASRQPAIANPKQARHDKK
jgi:hypothetical protein